MARYPGKRPATVRQVADLVAFMASPRAGDITGTVVPSTAASPRAVR